MYIPTDRPVYRILAPAGFYGPDDHLHKEGELVVYDETPNEEMEPMNDLARKAQAEYFEFLDECARKVAEKNGRAYVGRDNSLEDVVTLASQDARRVQLVQGDGGIPIMGSKKRGRPRIERLVEDAQTPQDGRRGKLANIR